MAALPKVELSAEAKKMIAEAKARVSSVFRIKKDAPCETCGDDPVACSSVPGLRHCEKANR